MTAPAPTCPLCGAPMKQRSGRFGEFWGCTKYPGCRGTRQIEDVPGEDDECESLAERDARRPEELLDL